VRAGGAASRRSGLLGSGVRIDALGDAGELRDGVRDREQLLSGAADRLQGPAVGERRMAVGPPLRLVPFLQLRDARAVRIDALAQLLVYRAGILPLGSVLAGAFPADEAFDLRFELRVVRRVILRPEILGYLSDLIAVVPEHRLKLGILRKSRDLGRVRKVVDALGERYHRAVILSRVEVELIAVNRRSDKKISEERNEDDGRREREHIAHEELRIDAPSAGTRFDPLEIDIVEAHQVVPHPQAHKNEKERYEYPDFPWRCEDRLLAPALSLFHLCLLRRHIQRKRPGARSWHAERA